MKPTNWQIRIYDTTGKLVDLPKADIQSWQFTDALNGGSGAGQIVFKRPFNQTGAVTYGYHVLIWFWDPDQTMTTDPQYSGYIIDFEQTQLEASGAVTATLQGDANLLDAAIVTEQINPSVDGNPDLDAVLYISHLCSTYQPTAFGTPTLPSSMFNMFPVNFDGTQLGAAIDTVVKQGRDLTGALWTWFVRRAHDLSVKLIVQPDQNPNLYSGLTFKHLFLESMIDEYDIQTVYRNIINVVAVYGGTDQNTGQQVYGAYQDAASVAEFDPIEGKITVQALTTEDGCVAYGKTYLTLNAYPQAQGSCRLHRADPQIMSGTWVQIWETPAVIKQVRVAQVDVQCDGERVDQVLTTTAPVPYLDEAVYKMGQNVATSQAIVNSPIAANKQTLYIRAGGTVSATASSPAKIALTATEAVFPSGMVSVAALSLTTLADTVTAATGDGSYTISVTSSGTYVITKGSKPQPTATQQNLVQVAVIGGVPWPIDIRTLSGQPAFSDISTPTLKSGTTVNLATPPNAGSGAYDQPFDFWLDPATWTKANPELAYLEIGSVVHSQPAPTNPYTTAQPTSDGHYTGTIPALGAGSAYDVYVRGHDNLDRATSWLMLGTTGTNALAPASLQQVPATGTPSAATPPTITGATAGTPFANGSAGTGVALGLTFADWATLADVPSWVAGFTIARRNHANPSQVYRASSGNPITALTLAGIIVDYPAGEAEDFGISIEDGQSGDTAITWPTAWSNIAAQQIAPVTVSNLTEFPGGYIESDGAWTNIDGVSSATQYSYPVGSVAVVKATITKGSSAGLATLVIGTAVYAGAWTGNGYGIVFDGTGDVYVLRVVSGVGSVIGSLGSRASDTNAHTLSLTLTVEGASNNLLGISLDGYDPNNGQGITDTGLDLTTGTWPITLQTGGSTGTVTGYTAPNPLVPQQIGAPLPTRKRILPDSTLVVDDTPGPVSGELPLLNHDPGVQPIVALMPAEAGADKTVSHNAAGVTDGTNTRSATAVATNMDASGNSLLTEFPGGKVNATDELTNVNGVSGATVYNSLVTGQPFSAMADISKGGTADAGLIIGDYTNGYGIDMDGTGSLYLFRFASGSFSAISTPIGGTNDTDYHSFRLTLTTGSPNVIEGSIDGRTFRATDYGAGMGALSPVVTLMTGGSTGMVRHYHVSATQQHYATLPSAMQTAVDPTGQVLNLGNVAHGSITPIATLMPEEAGANITENRTANDVLVGGGRNVAQAGADVTAGKPLSTLIGRTADKITYVTGGASVDSLMPAEAGANITETRYAAGTGSGGAQRTGATIAKIFDSVGNGLQTDFAGVVEADPTSSYAGYEILNATSGASAVAWEKTGISPSINDGPVTITIKGRAGSGGVMSVWLFGDSNPAGSAPTTYGYLAQWYGTTLYLYKKSSGSLSLLQSATVPDISSSGEDRTMIFTAWDDGTGLTSLSLSGGGVVLPTVKDDATTTGGYYGISAYNSPLYVRNFSIAQSSQVSGAIGFGQNSDPVGNAKTSAFMDTNIPNSNAGVVADVNMHIGGSGTTCFIWFRNNANTGGPSWKYSDGTVVTATAGILSTSPAYTSTGVFTNGTPIWVVAAWIPSSATWNIQVLSAAPTLAQSAVGLADGGLVATFVQSAASNAVGFVGSLNNVPGNSGPRTN